MKKRIITIQVIWSICSPFIALLFVKSMPTLVNLMYLIFFVALLVSQWLVILTLSVYLAHLDD